MRTTYGLMNKRLKYAKFIASIDKQRTKKWGRKK